MAQAHNLILVGGTVVVTGLVAAGVLWVRSLLAAESRVS